MNISKLNSTWQPSCSKKMLQLRAELLSNIRAFFKQKKILEVETPILSQSGSSDVFIDSFITFQYQNSLFEKKYFLHTSPEFAMKRLLASGSGDIYQIAKVFRQEESGHRHNPEFSLLEWYRLDFNEQQLMKEVAELVLSLFKQDLEVEYLSYKDCFLQNLSINPHSVKISELKACAKKYNLENTLLEEDSKDRWLELLLSCVIEKGLTNKALGGTQEQPKLTFIYDYPASQASLAKITINSSGEMVARRFELYIAGMEVANGFYELDDAIEQKKRFEHDNLQRIELGKPTIPFDNHLIDSLHHGLPSCAGVALGIDRLLMVLKGRSNINDVLSFSFDRA